MVSLARSALRVTASTPSRLRASALAGERFRRDGFLVLAGLALLYAGYQWVVNVRAGSFGFDFVGWRAAKDVLEGVSPYTPPRLATYRAMENPYVYPPTLAVLSVPLAALPFQVAAAVWAAANGLALGLALWIAGLRDRRCYVLVACSQLVVASLLFGQPDGVLALLLALVWRTRERAWRCGLWLGLLIALKIIAWPLIAWLWWSGRRQAALRTALCLLAWLALSWAALGFAGVESYPRVLATDATAMQAHTHSLVALLLRLGAGGTGARVLSLLAACALLVWARRSAELSGFALALAAGIVVSPIVHSAYLLALLVPLAIARPRLDSAWIVLLALWLSAAEPVAQTWQYLVPIAVAGAWLVGISQPGLAVPGLAEAQKGRVGGGKRSPP